MLFFKGKQKDGKPKKRSILGFLFNPEIGAELKPLGESARMFVRMLALVFAMSGLFPKDHPAIKDEKIRLTLGEVFGTAWNGFGFTREGLPQVLIFFAVVIMLVASALFIFVFIMALFSGGAHAADPGIFDEPAGRQDWAISWIDYLFHGEPITQLGGSTASAAKDCALQEALSKALGFFSSAVLIFAGILLLYHLMSMIIKTAQTGKPFEGANQVWAPIRLVFAIALLVPVNASTTGGGTCSITGYNSGQYLVMRVAKWGSSLGSNGWAFFLDGLNESEEPECKEGSAAPSCVGKRKGMVSLVQPLIVYDACAKLATYYYKEESLFGKSPYSVEGIDGTGTSEGKHYFGHQILGSTALNNAVGGFLGVKTKESRLVCGGYDVTERPEGDYGVVYDKQMEAFSTLKGEIHKFNVDYFMLAVEKENFKGSLAQYNAAVKKQKKEYEDLIKRFQNDLNVKTKFGLAAASIEAKKSIEESLKSKKFREYGWLMAGAWFNTIARLQANKFQAVSNSLPIPLKPDPLLFNNDNPEYKERLNDVGKSTRKALDDYQDNLSVINDYIDKETPDSVVAEAGADGITKSRMLQFFKSMDPVERSLGWLDAVGGGIGLWNPAGTLAVEFGMSQNPIAEITAFGQKNITIGSIALSAAAVSAIAGGASAEAGFVIASVKYSFASIANFLTGILVSVASIFFLIGFTLGFIVPLYPFYRFFFGSLTWIMSVFEAVVLVPLFALAHINPGGDGLPGPKAAYGYQVGMQILLRPILMVFGLVAGFLLFKIMLTFLNVAFVIVSHGTGAYLGMNAFLAKLVYSILYAVIVLILANTCFKTIGLFPQVALSWLGYQRPHEERPDTDKLTVAATYLSNQAIQKALPSMVKGPSDVVKGFKESRRTSQNEATATAHRREDVAMQQQLLDKLDGNTSGNQGGGHGHAPSGGRSFSRGGGGQGGGGNTGAGGGNIIQPSGGGQGPRSTTKFDKDGKPIK